MLIQTLILIIAFIANIWLWGHWSFDKPLGLSLFLVVTSLMMLGVCWLSLTTFIKKRSLKELNTKKLWKIFLIVYVLFVALLCGLSFYGLIQYLLPIKLLMFGIYLFLRNWPTTLLKGTQRKSEQRPPKG